MARGKLMRCPRCHYLWYSMGKHPTRSQCPRCKTTFRKSGRSVRMNQLEKMLMGGRMECRL